MLFDGDPSAICRQLSFGARSHEKADMATAPDLLDDALLGVPT